MVSNCKKGIESGVVIMFFMVVYVVCVWYIENNINIYYKLKLNGNIWVVVWVFIKDVYLFVMV